MHRWADDLASQRRNPDRNEHFIHDLNHQPPALKRGTCSPSYIAGRCRDQRLCSDAGSPRRLPFSLCLRLDVTIGEDGASFG
eukprot:m.211394 g.211394  ORF g.211394 m.211394 type:complete len:82 (+) comp15492_c0_seq11:392-637(+)